MKIILHPFQFRFKRTLPFLAALLLCAAVRAQLLIDVGEVLLRPDEAGQAVQFFVENRGASPVNVSGLSLNLQVADSGPPSEGGLGTLDGPNISAVDLLTGTPFAANNTGPVNAGSIAQFANWTITTASSFVSLGAGARVPLATITFDTRGFASGSWDLALGNTLNGPTKYFRIDGANVTDINPQILDGTLRLLAPVPEPAHAALAGAVALLAWAAWRRPRPVKKHNLTLAALALACVMPAMSTSADEDGGQRRQPPELPTPLCGEVNVPAGHRVSSHVYALGVQIYRWNGASWTFVAPEAALYADPCYEGQVGIHYAGPTWEAIDGSQVTGVRLTACAPSRGIIPWLRLGATSAPGHGRFARLTFIQRVNTIGGVVPAEPGAFVGEEARVPYTAEYYFYRAAKG